jgi:hypothetical protein
MSLKKLFAFFDCDKLQRRERQPCLNPARLVFIDETWASTNMARRYRRAPRGQRLDGAVPHGHWKTTIFVAGLRCDQLTAPCVRDGAINGEWFRASVEQGLAKRGTQLPMPKATSIAKECCAPGGGGGKGAARRTRATLSPSRSASLLDRSKETDVIRPNSSRPNPIIAIPLAARWRAVSG